MTIARPKVLKKGGKERLGRGFSSGELERAELSPKDALRFGIPIDSRRKTAHDENIEAVKTYLQKRKSALKPGKSKRKSKS
jgi:large subunit ribosomal protein L13e